MPAGQEPGGGRGRGPLPGRCRSPPGPAGEQVPGTGAALPFQLLSAALLVRSKGLIEAQVITQSVLLRAEYLILLYVVVTGKVCPNV